MSKYSFLIDNMVWSYSRLSCYQHCPYEFKLQYIEEYHGENNFYAEFGKYCHTILEKYTRGELGVFELPDYFDEHFDEFVGEDVNDRSGVTREKYKTLGHDYFENIDLELDRFEILGIEKECNFEIGGKNFIGYIDLLLKEKSTGHIYLIDHKSSEYPLGKKGAVKKAEAEKFEGYKKQLYLYCIQVYNEYGFFPHKIGWNYFKAQKWLFLDFDKDEYEKAKQWALGIIGEINQEEDFRPNPSFFYCRNLCAFRNQYCEYKEG